MKTIAIINDRPILRQGLTMIIKDTYHQMQVCESATLQQFLELYPEENPELVFLSILCRAEKDCVNLAKQVRSLFPKAGIIAYVENLNTELIVSYFKNGIQSILSPQCTVDELTSSIDASMREKPYMNQELFFLMMPFFTEKIAVHTSNQVDFTKIKDLAKREKEVAHYLNLGMKSTQIARKLGVQPSTVSTMKKNIFTKMNVDNVLELREALENSVNAIAI